MKRLKIFSCLIAVSILLTSSVSFGHDASPPGKESKIEIKDAKYVDVASATLEIVAMESAVLDFEIIYPAAIKPADKGQVIKGTGGSMALLPYNGIKRPGITTSYKANKKTVAIPYNFFRYSMAFSLA